MSTALFLTLVAIAMVTMLRGAVAARLAVARSTTSTAATSTTVASPFDGPLVATCKGFSQRLDINKAKIFKKLDGAKSDFADRGRGAVEICRSGLAFSSWERDLSKVTSKNLITAQGQKVSQGPVAACFANLQKKRALYYQSIAEKVASVTKDVLESSKTDVLSAAALARVKKGTVTDLWKAFDGLTQKVASRFTIGHDLFECYVTHASRGREGFSKSTAADLRDRAAGVKDSYDAFERHIRSQHARELGFDV